MLPAGSCSSGQHEQYRLNYVHTSPWHTALST
jgi:hypothetical protein